MTGPTATDPTPLPGNRWPVQMLGGPQWRGGDLRIVRFPDRPTRRLFARLALQPHVLHGRDNLAQALLPEMLDADGRRERSWAGLAFACKAGDDRLANVSNSGL